MQAFRTKKKKLVEETADLAGRRVLLADDVDVNAEIMMMVLSMREITAEHAENGKIAVDARLFSEIVRKLPEDEVNITVSDTLQVKITSGKAHFEIAGKDAAGTGGAEEAKFRQIDKSLAVGNLGIEFHVPPGADSEDSIRNFRLYIR